MVNYIFLARHVKNLGVVLGEIDVGRLVKNWSNCSPPKKCDNRRGPLSFVMPLLGVHVDLYQLENEATFILHVSGNHWSHLPFFLKKC